MRWIAASLLAINVVVLIVQLVLPRHEALAAAERATPVEQNASSLQLLGELDMATLQSMLIEKERARVAARIASKASQPLCTLVGPFPELLKAEYFVEHLAALDVSANIEEVETPGEVGYWIYLPPRESRRQAYNLLRELQAKGIDSYVIPRGELAFGISFGMFSKPELAANRLEDMRSRGYAAELKEIIRPYKETWVVLEPGQAGQVADEIWQQMLAEVDGLERRQNFCPAVASR